MRLDPAAAQDLSSALTDEATYLAEIGYPSDARDLWDARELLDTAIDGAAGSDVVVPEEAIGFASEEGFTS